jgi:hypothetical protein
VLVGTSQVVPATARGGSRGPRPDQATSFFKAQKERDRVMHERARVVLVWA